MSDWRSLTDWMTAPVDPGRAVAIAGANVMDEAAFRTAVRGWMAVLHARPVVRVGVFLSDPAEFASALLAVWQVGAQAILPADMHPATLAALRGRMDIWLTDDGVKPLSPGQTDTEIPPWRVLLLSQPAVCLFTSGSTGEPQPFAKSLAQLCAELEALERAFGHGLDACTVHSTVSHQHIYGLLFRVLWPLSAGRVISRQRLEFSEQIAAALSERPGILVSTPAHLSRLLDLPQWRDAATGVRRVFSSGGALSDAAVALVRGALVQPVHEIYGSTETGGIAWRERDERNAAWQPLPGVTVRIDEGCLAVQSPFLADPDHWYRCQDHAEVVDNGFALLGRADRIAKVEERRVSLVALESALAREPGVRSVRTLLLPGRRRVVGAVVQIDHAVPLPIGAVARRLLANRLRLQLVDGFDRVCWPRQWRFVHELPEDTQGKLSESRLQRLFASELPAVEWQLREPEHARLRCQLDRELAVFSGHFPQAPVLPGVALLDWVAQWGGEVFDLAGPFCGIEQLKFQRIARPGMSLEVSLNCSLGGTRIVFAVNSDLGQHASGRLLFAEASS